MNELRLFLHHLVALVTTACSRIAGKREPGFTVEDRGEICFYLDQSDRPGYMLATVAPKGCYSTTCTRQVQKVGTAIVDRHAFTIQFSTRFDLAQTSRAPLTCGELPGWGDDRF